MRPIRKNREARRNKSGRNRNRLRRALKHVKPPTQQEIDELEPSAKELISSVSALPFEEQFQAVRAACEANHKIILTPSVHRWAKENVKHCAERFK